MNVLDVIEVTKDFGGLRANNKISFSTKKGELVGLIGPNGAGKTTLFNCICGYHQVTSGRIIFYGEDITPLKPHEVARKGLARTFQVYLASGDLTVEENIMVGCFMRTRSSEVAKSKAKAIMERLKLTSLADHFVTDLPIAAQKKVSMATALGTEPRLLLLDEVAAGLNPSEIDEIMESIRHIHEDMGVDIILIEHVMELVMRISHRVIVLESGVKIADGDPASVASDPNVIKAYLGEKFAEEQILMK